MREVMSNYYECHVTIEPVYEDNRAIIERLAKQHKFSLAELMMQKRQNDTPERSKYDTFCTGRSYDIQDLSRRMEALVLDLRSWGFTVWRYKIELTVLDSRYGDTFGLLDKAAIPLKELNPKDPVFREV